MGRRYGVATHVCATQVNSSSQKSHAIETRPMTPGLRRLYVPRPERVAVGDGGRPLAVDGVAVEAVREEWVVEDRWWTPKPLQPPLLRAGARRRPRRGRLPQPRQRPLVPAAGLMDEAAPYVELHAHSAFSFLDGASTPTELAAAAAELGYPAFALTDHDGVWGSMEFAAGLQGAWGPRPITGAELTVGVGRYGHLTLLVENAAGYRNLCRLLTAAHSHTRDNTARSAEQPWVTLEQVEEHAEGLVCLSGCAGDGAVAGALRAR